MTNDHDVLRIATKELLPDNTRIFLAENGVKYFYKTSWPHQLYVQEQGKELYAQLPSGIRIDAIDLSGNDIYFAGIRKIFKAVTDEFGKIRIHFVRELHINETVTRDAICLRTIDGAKRALRMTDYPNISEGIAINVVDEMCQGQIKGIHRGKLVYLDYCGPNQPASVKMEDNAIFLELPLDLPTSRLFAQDSTYLYVSEKNKVFVINTDAIEIVSVLDFRGITER